MNTGSLSALVAAMGCAAVIAACSSSSPTGGASSDAGAGGSSAGGKTAAGGAVGSGGKGAGGNGAGGKGAGGTSSGGSGGETSDAGDAGSTGGAGSGGDTGSGGAGGNPGAGGSTGGATGSGGTTGDAGCVYPQCLPKYPTVIAPPENPYTDDKAMLGKILFWDEQMGQLDTMACGTCHRAASGGSDPRTNDPVAKLPGPDGIAQTQPDVLSDDLRVAQGVPVCDHSGTITGSTTPQTTGRKPPTYLDAMFAGQIFWDGRAGYCKNNEGQAGGCFYDPDLPGGSAPIIIGTTTTTGVRIAIGGALEAQASGPPASSVEMACAGRTWADIETKFAKAGLIPLAKTNGRIPQAMKDFIAAHGNNYPQMFKDVYGSDPTTKVNAGDPDNVINARRIVFAIATHERRLTSDQTPWDLWNDGTPEHANALTANQIAGFKLFMGKARCAVCHAPPLFTDNTFHNIGFHEPSWDSQHGRQFITNAAADAGKYKTPTLRNVALREPFGLLHEGDGPGHNLDTILALYNSGGKPSDPLIAPEIDTALLPLALSPSEISQILDFLRNGLTDPRVTAETSPFDRPKLGTEP